MNNGDMSEMLICKSLQMCGMKQIKTTQFARLKESTSAFMFNRDFLKYTMDSIKKILGKKHLFYFQSGSEAANSTADVTLYKSKDCVKGLGISIKHNNFSIKHQRPGNLWNQAKFKGKDINDFQEEYQELNDMWYFKIKKYKTFQNIPSSLKNSMYKDFNQLAIDWLNKEKTSIPNLLLFLWDYDTRFIVHCNFYSKTINLYTKEKLPTNNISTVLSDSNTTIKFTSNKLQIITMRLHTCQSQITPRLGIKYDSNVNPVFLQPL